MKRRALIAAVIVFGLAALAIRESRSHRKEGLGQAFIGGHGITVWNSTAEVRVPVTTLPYGMPVEVLDRQNNEAEIRTAAGVQGWIEARALLEPAVWRDAAALDQASKSLVAQARGETRVRTNFHTAPGRSMPVIFEAPNGVPVLMFERKAEPVPKSQGAADTGAPRFEDWWLVRAQTKDAGEIAGWILGRFVNLDLPDPLSGYASSENINVTGWYEINRAVDANGAVKPEYLMVGTRGPEGQPCDFTLARVYTWSLAHNRYETAFVENDLCGSLPVEVTPASIVNGDGFFRFRNTGPRGIENREYGMKFTIVRRVGGRAPVRRGRRR
jgi:hypothetical protein